LFCQHFPGGGKMAGRIERKPSACLPAGQENAIACSLEVILEALLTGWRDSRKDGKERHPCAPQRAKVS